VTGDAERAARVFNIELGGREMRTLICALALVSGGLCSTAAEPIKTKPDAERVKGMKAAVGDIEKGVLKLIFPPAPTPLSQLEYAKLLKTECGVEATVAGFDLTEGGEKANAGYNDVMRIEIEHRFGAGVLDRLQKRAEEIADGTDGKGKGDGKNYEPPRGANVFVHPEKLTPKDELSDGKGISGRGIEITSETTLIWIDLAPNTMFSHATKYVLISADGVRIVSGSWRPVLNGKELFHDGKAYKQEFPIELSEESGGAVKVEKKWDAMSTNAKDNDLWK
jgi:hypothetical protein